MSDLDTKQIERMHQLHASQKVAFEADRHRSYSDRIADIKKIEALTEKYAGEIREAVDQDYGGRSHNETQLTEIAFVKTEAAHIRRHLWSWMQPQKVPVAMNLKPGKAYVRREPVGVVGIIAPWNYPFQLAFAPLLAALACGCRIMLKPSELTPRTSELMRKMIAEVFSEDQIAVITGGPDVGAAFSSIPFDHLLYTGSTAVGRLVAKAAAENLTPVTLELGGKSPVIMAEDYPAEKAAYSIGFGKFMNAGQSCIAPDYVLAPESHVRPFAQALLQRVQDSYPDWGNDSDFTSIIAERHHQRLKDMLEEARSAGAELLQPEGSDPGNLKKIPPTIVLNAPEDSRLMQEEIFGPVLPVLSHNGIDDAIRRVNAKDRPLALYAYAKSKKTARKIIEGTISGGAVVNNTMLHYSVADLPFGGVGASGQGAYHGEAGYETFTHARAVFEAPIWHPSRLLAPPFGKLFKSIAYK